MQHAIWSKGTHSNELNRKNEDGVQMTGERSKDVFGRHVLARIGAMLIVAAAGIVLVKILTVTLNQEDFGLYSLWKSLAIFIYSSSSSVFIQSILRYMQRRTAKSRLGASRLLSASLIGSFSVLSCIVTLLLLAYVITGFKIINDSMYLISLALISLFMILQIIERIVLSISDSEQNSREVFVYSLSYGLVSSVTAALFAMIIGDFRWVFAGFIVGHFIPALGSLRVKIKDYHLSTPTRTDFKQIMAYGGPVFVEETAANSVVFIASYIVSLWMGFTYVALLSIALVISGILLSLVGPPLNAYMAYLVKAYETESYDETNHLNRRLLELSLVIIPLMIILVTLVSPFIVQIVSTTDYIDAALLIPFTILASVLLLLSNIWKYTLRLTERTHIIASISLFSVCILVVLCMILIPYMGLIGIGFALVGRAFIEITFLNRAVDSSMRVTISRDFQRAWVVSILVLIGSCSIVYIWTLDWFISVIGSILIYVIVTWKLDILNLTDVLQLLRRTLTNQNYSA